MTKNRERTLKELYDVTEEIMEAEITPVLKGSCRIQGPMNETEVGTEKKMGSSRAGKRSGRHSVKGKDSIKEESGTCNVCAAPCSSCMHFKRAGSCREVKIEGELSNEVSTRKETSQCSLNDAKPLSLKNRACSNQQSIANETSNLVSPSSSHDSFSENAESKASFHKSTDFSNFPRVPIAEAVTHDELISNQQNGTVNISLRSRVASDLGQRILPNQYEEQKVLEHNSDNVSCVSGGHDANMPVGDLNVDVDRKNILSSTASVNSLPEGSQKIVNLQSAPGCLAGFNCEDIDIRKYSKTNMLSKETTPKDRTTSSENVDLLHKSDGVLSSKDLSAGSSPQNEQIENCTPSAEVPNTQDLHLKSQPANESDGSDIVEDDVKVCDICGDAGREDKLAICSRCTDGAEHTYCMRKMMDEVPEGDWLCEECQLKEDDLKAKLNKFETVSGIPKLSPVIEKSEKSGAALSSKILPKLNTKLPDAESDRATKVVPSPHSSAKRHSENIENAPAAKRLAVESNVGSPKLSSPSKRGTLSRESSFKNIEKGKVKPIHAIPSSEVKPMHQIPSPGVPSANNSHDLGRSHAISAQNSSRIQNLVSPRGTLLKSSSFSSLNSKPKVKPIQDVPQKHRLTRNSSISDTKKDGLVRTLSKSQSFKPGSTQSNSTESKSKLPSSNLSRAEDSRALKAKERSTIERKSSFVSDRLVSPTVMAEQKGPSRGESTSVLSSAINSRDSKVVQLDGKSNIASKSVGILSHKGGETPNTMGCADIKRSSSVSSCGAGHPSLNGNLAEKRGSQVSPKEVPVENSSCTADRPPCGNNANVGPQVPQSRESSNQDRKARDPSFSQPKQSVSSGVRSIRCQKCKEIGHGTQFCPNATLAAVETSAARTPRESMDRSTILKDSSEAALLKSSAMGNKGRFPSQSDDLPVSSTGLSSAVASKDQLSSPTNFLRNLTNSDGVHDGQENFKNSTTDSIRAATVNDVKPQSSCLKEAVCTPEGDPDEIGPSDEANFKPSSSDLPRLASSFSISSTHSPKPEQDCIWEGGFEVRKSGILVGFYDGIQAHLSSCASPKVPEVVNKFPHKILLEEVPRLSTWPKQFQNCVTEDNIAFYVFVRNDESHTRSYKSLLEGMIKNDLALKGNFDGIELLIFPSNQFSVGPQRFNMSHFLWGVFRAKRLSYSDHVSGPQKKLSGADLNVAPSEDDSDIPDTVDSGRECSSEKQLLDLSNNGGFPKEQEAIKSSSSEPLLSYSSPGGVQTKCKRDESSMEAGAIVGSRTEEIMKDRSMLNDAGLPLLRSDKDHSSSWVAQSSQKRPFSAPVDMISQTSGETSAGTTPFVSWGVIRPGNMLVDGDSEQKKMKRCYTDIYSDGNPREQNLSDEFLPQMHRPRLDGPYADTVMQPSSRTSEMHFFPLDLFDPAKNLRPRADVVPVQILSSDDEDQMETNEVPNLELGLGGDKKMPKQGVLPLFTVLADKKNKRGKHPDTTEDDCGADLSLSLSVPFSDKEKTMKHVSRPAQPLPEKSPLFFGGFSGPR